MGNPCESRLLAVPVCPRERSPLCSRSAGRTRGRAMLKQAVPAALDPVGGTHARAVCGVLYHRRRNLQWRSSWRTVSHGWNPMMEQGKSEKRSARDNMMN